MSIWEHKFDGPEPTFDIVNASTCIYCGTQLIELHKSHEDVDLGEIDGQPVGGVQWIKEVVQACPTCGWWSKKATDFSNTGEIWVDTYGAYGELRQLDLTDVNAPIEEVKAFLLAKADARYGMHPRLFEETVASVFRDLGYSVTVTAYQNDGGIDAVLVGPDKDQVGVQVKRYKNRIDVEQIRAFTGALFLQGHTRGIYVTTSKFQSGAGKTAALSAARGLPIELVDWERFFESLKIGTRKPYTNYEEWKECTGEIELHQVDHFTA